MPSTVVCSCVKQEPYPGYFIYNVTIRFNYTGTPGFECCRMPPPVATYFIGGVESSALTMSEGSPNVWTATTTGLTAAPNKAKVYFKEISATQDVESTGCPCTTTTSKRRSSKTKKK